MAVLILHFHFIHQSISWIAHGSKPSQLNHVEALTSVAVPDVVPCLEQMNTIPGTQYKVIGVLCRVRSTSHSQNSQLYVFIVFLKAISNFLVSVVIEFEDIGLGDLENPLALRTRKDSVVKSTFSRNGLATWVPQCLKVSVVEKGNTQPLWQVLLENEGFCSKPCSLQNSKQQSNS